MRVEYVVKKEEGIVVALLKDCDFDVYSDLAKRDLDVALLSEMDDHIHLIINSTYKGVARLSEGDVWDEEFGKELAKTKAVNKYLMAKKKALLKFVSNSYIFKQILALDDYYSEKLG